MSKSSQTVILEIKHDRNFRGTCPACYEDFSLADAVMYSSDDDAPEVAIAAIKKAREAIRLRKQAIAKAIELMTNRSQRTTEAVNIGKIVEKIVPSFSSFAHHPGDCRALFDPIDYVIFSGLASRGHVDSLLFVDIKSGGSRLNQAQRSIKKAILDGAVNFGTINPARPR